MGESQQVIGGSAGSDNQGLPLLIGGPATWSRGISPPPWKRNRPAGRPAAPGWEPKLPQSPPEGHAFVYLMRSLQFVKIGRAANLYVRFSNVRVDNPHDPQMVRYWECSEKGSKLVERLAHVELFEYRHRGDWFICSVEMAIEAIERLLKYHP